MLCSWKDGFATRQCIISAGYLFLCIASTLLILLDCFCSFLEAFCWRNPQLWMDIFSTVTWESLLFQTPSACPLSGSGWKRISFSSWHRAHNVATAVSSSCCDLRQFHSWGRGFFSPDKNAYNLFWTESAFLFSCLVHWHYSSTVYAFV